MSTLIPLARRFYQKIDALILDELKIFNKRNSDIDKDEM